MRSGRPRFLGADILTCSVIWCNAAFLSWSLQDGGSAVGRLAVGHNGITWHAWRLAQSAGSPLTEQQTRLASGYMFTKVHRHAKGAKPSARIKTLRSSSTWEPPVAGLGLGGGHQRDMLNGHPNALAAGCWVVLSSWASCCNCHVSHCG